MNKLNPDKLDKMFYLPLTETEEKIFSYIIKGFTNEQIAKKLFVSPHTIKTHRNRIYLKFIDSPDFPSSTKAIRMALKYHDLEME